MAHVTADVIIIGAGPAGCLAAAGVLAGDPDLSVTIVDPCPGGKHRIGEALLTGTIMTLADAGMSEDIGMAGFHLKKGGAYRWGASRDTWYVNYPAVAERYPGQFMDAGERRAIHVPRHVFDAKLQDIVHRRGVSIAADSVIGVETGDGVNGPRVRKLTLASGRSAYAKHYIDCSGQAAILSRRLSERTRLGTARIARYAYSRHVDWGRAELAGFEPHRTNIISCKNGWLWAIHLGEAGDGLTSIGFVSDPDTLSRVTPDNCLEAFPDLRLFGFEHSFGEVLSFDGTPRKGFYGHPDYSYASKDLHGENWSMAGDAALFIDPILSQGVTLSTHYGFLRGKAAAAQIAGMEGTDLGVTRHYRREAKVMSEVVAKWYCNNSSVTDWKLAAAAQVHEEYGIEMDPDDAFMWITNLENIRDEYDPYPVSERDKIDVMLGVSEGGLRQ